MQHQVWLLTLDGRLTTVWLPAVGGPVLDLGTGTGAWALAIAKEFPAKQIIATDLTPPSVPTPPNVTFLKVNAEHDWAFGQHFSFIHGRMLTSGIHDWPKLLEQCYQNLEPGGWLELLDLCHPFQAENPDSASEKDGPPAPGFLRWGQMAEHCWALSGLDYRATNKHESRLRDLGFVDIHEANFKWPLGTWSDKENEKRLGELTLRNFTTFLKIAGADIIKQDPDVTGQEAQLSVSMALKDLSENSLRRKYYLKM